MEEKTKYQAFFDEVSGLNIPYLDALLESMADKSFFQYSDEWKYL